ncbi:MAG: amidoligase family protein [Armatimonadota bacterium]
MGQTQVASSKAEAFRWGCELEVFLAQDVIQRHGISIGSYHHGHPLPAPFPQGWTAERDGSLHTDRRGYVGVEIVSPILKGRAGIEQVKQVAQILREMGASVNHTAAVHLHLSPESVVGPSSSEIAEFVAKLLYQTAQHETALYASTGTHRRENGQYARSIKRQKQDADRIRKATTPARKREELSWVVSQNARYHSLNLTNLFTSKATVEWRVFASTTSWQKLVGHICTCLALAERATETTRMDWEAVASEKTYQVKGRGLRELNRLFYLTGWTLGRRDVGQAEVGLAGWIAPIEDLNPVKAALRKLARKYSREEQDGGVA